MAMVVKNNMSAVSTLNTLNKNSNALQKSLSKVSSGMKINSAQDDASGYAISERMRVQIRSLDQANQNTQNGSSMMKTAEGAVSSTVEILKSLKEKAINAANDTNKDSDRVTIQKEIDQFIDQIDDNALTTFNGKYLVDGSKAQEGGETFTAMTNQSLSTKTSGASALTALKNRNDESLEIRSTDYVTASFVQNGNTYTTKFKVGTDTDLKAIFSKLNEEYTTQNAGNAGSATAIFGAAQLPAEGSSSAIDSSDAATQALSTLTVDSALLKEALNANTTDANAQTLQAAVSFLAKDGKTADQIAGYISGVDTVSDARAALQSKVVDALKAVEVTLTNNSADNFNSGNDASFSAGLLASDGTTDLGISAGQKVTLKGNGDSASTTKLTTVDTNVGTGASATSDTELTTAAGKIMDVVAAEVGKVVNGDTGAASSIADAVSNATTVKLGTTSAKNNSGGDVALTNDQVFAVSTTTGKNGAVADSGSNKEVENYGNAVMLAKVVANASGGGGDVEILNGSKIGKNAAGDLVTTADGTEGLTITAANGGVSGQVSGVTISITDSEGNVKKAANAALDDFRTTIYAKNKSDRNELSFQVGAAANQAIAVGLEDMRSEALGLKGSDGSKVSVATQDKANAAVAVFDNAIQKALDQQTTIGAIEARLEYTSQNLTTSSENVQAAESTIRDADMAKEMTNYTKNNVLLQAAQSMLAQANQSSSAVLSLLQ